MEEEGLLLVDDYLETIGLEEIIKKDYGPLRGPNPVFNDSISKAWDALSVKITTRPSKNNKKNFDDDDEDDDAEINFDTSIKRSILHEGKIMKKSNTKLLYDIIFIYCFMCCF